MRAPLGSAPESEVKLPRIWKRGVSQIIRAYALWPDFPTKLRIFGAFRRWTGYPRLTVPLTGDGWITVDERDYVCREIFCRGAFEPEVWEALEPFLDGEETIWDVGAHIGSFAVRALRDSRVRRVVAFEPDPQSVGLLQLHMRWNGYGKGMTFRLALSDSSARRALVCGPLANTGLSSLSGDTVPGRRTAQVECETADRLIFEREVPPPTILKIDVEDWEVRVVEGARGLLKKAPPKAMAIESRYTGIPPRMNPPLREVLESAGYQVRWIPRPSGELQERENFLAVGRKDRG